MVFDEYFRIFIFIQLHYTYFIIEYTYNKIMYAEIDIIY